MHDTLKAMDVLMSRHRNLKGKIAALQAELDIVRTAIEEHVAEHGNYTDGLGYARLTRPSAPSTSYKSADVHKLAVAWQQSDDPVMHSCGVMLAQHGTEKPGGTRTLQVK